jgi:hypothetical protein
MCSIASYSSPVSRRTIRSICHSLALPKTGKSDAHHHYLSEKTSAKKKQIV